MRGEGWGGSIFTYIHTQRPSPSPYIHIPGSSPPADRSRPPPAPDASGAALLAGLFLESIVYIYAYGDWLDQWNCVASSRNGNRQSRGMLGIAAARLRSVCVVRCRSIQLLLHLQEWTIPSHPTPTRQLSTASDQSQSIGRRSIVIDPATHPKDPSG